MFAEFKIKNSDGKWEKIENAGGLNGIKVSVIGDSTLAVADNCVDQLKAEGQMILQNLAESGTGFATIRGRYATKIEYIDLEADIIIVGVGFNDTRTIYPVGTADDMGDSTLGGIVNDFMDKIETAFPKTPIVLFSEGCTTERRPGVQKSDDWYTLIEQICLKRCVPFYQDLYRGCVLKPWLPANQQEYYVDQNHLNRLGSAVLAKYLKGVIWENVNPRNWTKSS